MTNHHVMMSGKIHRATVTVADLDYEDSISIDTQLLQLANIAAGEQVSIYTVCTGARLELYAITDAIGEVCLNGAAAGLLLELSPAESWQQPPPQVQALRQRLGHVEQ